MNGTGKCWFYLSVCNLLIVCCEKNSKYRLKRDNKVLEKPQIESSLAVFRLWWKAKEKSSEMETCDHILLFLLCTTNISLVCKKSTCTSMSFVKLIREQDWKIIF